MLRKRLIWQLYLPFLAITVVAVVATTAYFSYTFRGFYLDHTRRELHNLAGVAIPQIAQILTSTDSTQVDALAKRFGQATAGHVRFTVIAPPGRVLGDSYEDPTVMQNHSDRQEIVEALRDGDGQSMRFSPTLGHKMMYVAVAIQQDGQPVAIVRTALALTAIDETLRAISLSVAWAGLVIALVAAGLSLLISRSISQPIVRVRRIAQLFARGQLNIRVPAGGTAELDDLATVLNEMAVQLQDRITTITTQRNELEAILSSMIEGLFAVDSQGRIVTVNRAAAHLLAIDPAWAQGRSVEEAVRNADLQQFVRDTLRKDRPTEGDVSLLTEGGRFFHVRGASLTGERGQRSGAVIVLSDMTRIQRLETVRRDFVANVSHELKTPVTSIQGFVEALQEDGLRDPEQARRYLDVIARHAQRLNAIIDDLLSLSRLEEGAERRAISFETTRLRPVLEAAISLSRIKADDKQMKLDVACDEQIEARVSPPLLEQAVFNLVDNAVKYSEPGHTVDVRADQTENETTIAVRDQGSGIPAHHLERIFERFYVVDKSRSRNLGGTGLGLAIVKHIAQVHGGRVTVESTPGHGSTFTIHLPRGS